MRPVAKRRRVSVSNSITVGYATRGLAETTNVVRIDEGRLVSGVRFVVYEWERWGEIATTRRRVCEAGSRRRRGGSGRRRLLWIRARCVLWWELVQLLDRLVLIEDWRRLLNSEARRVLRQELIYLLERRVLVDDWRRLPRRRCPL